MMPEGWAKFTKIVCGVVAGVAIASVTAGIGSVVAAAALNGLVDATAQLLAQSIILLYDVAAGEPETEFNWVEIYLAGLTGAALGGATTAIANLKPLADSSKAVLSSADDLSRARISSLSFDDSVDAGELLISNLKDDAAKFQAKFVDEAAGKNLASNIQGGNILAETDRAKLQEFYFNDPNSLPSFFKPYNFGN